MRETKLKNTDIGMIPYDWNITSLNSQCSIKARIGWQGLRSDEYLSNGDYYLITGTDFHNGYIKWDSCRYVSEYRFKQDTNIQIHKGDVLVTKDGTIGKVAYLDQIPGQGTLNSGVFVIRPTNENILQSYLQWIFKSMYFDDFINQITAGSTIVHLYQKDIVNFCFPLPPLDEQRKIAKALSDIDGLISSLAKLIEKKQNIKTATMQQLLTGKKRLEGFTEPWVETTFKDIYSFASEGGTPSTSNSAFYNGNIPFAKVEDTERKYLCNTKITISDEGLRNSSAWIIPSNNILFTNGATIGNVSINIIPVCTKQGILGIIVKETYDVEFLFYLLSSSEFQREVHSRESKGTFATIILKNMNEIPIYVPSKKTEQTAIANILTDMDAEISALESKKAKYESIKKGMMQELLTGRIRLV